MSYKWFFCDGVSLPVSETVMSENQGEDFIEISNNYFEEFDYGHSTKIFV
jgi:hypothetical protein